jgi:hypothetical protein
MQPPRHAIALSLALLAIPREAEANGQSTICGSPPTR